MGTDRFIYGYVTTAEYANKRAGKSVIDLETGEIIRIPYLDLPLPDGYTLAEDEEKGEG